MKKLFLALVVLAVALAGCGKEEAKEEKLLIYAGLMEDHAAMAVKEFEKETGIKTEFVRMSSGETLARVRAEKDNMSASVWYGGPVDAFVAANEEGLIEAYKSPVAEKIPAKFKDEDGTWTGIYVGYLGFVGNKSVLEEMGAEMPKSWEDLLKAEYAGEVVTAHPGSSGTAYTMLSTVVQLMGEQEGMEYMQKLNKQVRQYTKSGTAPGRMVGLGEAGVGITFLHDAIKYRKEGYKDIIIAAPAEGTGFEIGAVALLKNGPDSENAKKFIDWALSKKAQEMGQTVGSYQFLTNSEAVPPKEAMEIKDTKLIDYDFEWAGLNRRRLIEEFSRVSKTTAPTK